MMGLRQAVADQNGFVVRPASKITLCMVATLMVISLANPLMLLGGLLTTLDLQGLLHVLSSALALEGGTTLPFGSLCCA